MKPSILEALAKTSYVMLHNYETGDIGIVQSQASSQEVIWCIIVRTRDLIPSSALYRLWRCQLDVILKLQCCFGVVLQRLEVDNQGILDCKDSVIVKVFALFVKDLCYQWRVYIALAGL